MTSPVDIMTCPTCGMEGPPTKFCLNCGTSKDVKPEASNSDILVEEENKVSVYSDTPDQSVDAILEENTFEKDEIIYEQARKTNKSRKSHVKMKSQRNKQETKLETKHVRVSDLDSKVDPIVRENMLNLAKSIDLKNWLVNQLLQGEIEEEQFNKLFENYEVRYQQCMIRRNQLLENAQNIKPIQKKFKEAKLSLSEIEKKKIIGDISDEEYNLKAPVYKWDMDNYEREIAKRKAEILVLKDLTHVMTEENIDEIKKSVEASLEAVDDYNKSGTITSETATIIKNSLENTLSKFNNKKVVIMDDD
jgi:hypothetical protein